MAAVPQDLTLFNESIYYNIAYGREAATEEEVYRAARRAAIDSQVCTALNYTLHLVLVRKPGGQTCCLTQSQQWYQRQMPGLSHCAHINWLLGLLQYLSCLELRQDVLILCYRLLHHELPLRAVR